ncbi:MAG: hypothetical protein ACM31L_05020 [Actinomycetota bacterium]
MSSCRYRGDLDRIRADSEGVDADASVRILADVFACSVRNRCDDRITISDEAYLLWQRLFPVATKRPLPPCANE